MTHGNARKANYIAFLDLTAGWRFESSPVHHLFISTLKRRQVIEKWCRCGGSIESIAVVRNSFRKEQLLQSLLVVEGRLDPQVWCARQNTFCERQDALYVEFVDRFGVPINLRERQFLAELV